MKLTFPFINMPGVFINILKEDISFSSSPDLLFASLRPERAFYSALEQAFQEFDDGGGIERVLLALGWSNFRDRLCSIFIFKNLYGTFPLRTDPSLVEDVKNFEERFRSFSVASSSRLFLLGFYLRLANLELQQNEDNKFCEIKISQDVESILKISQVRSQRIDWLILIVFHLLTAFGEKQLAEYISSGKKMDELFELIPRESQQVMLENLLSYGASIQEADIFIYDKV